MTQPALPYTEEGRWSDSEQEILSIYPRWMKEAICSGMEETVFFGSSDPNVRPQYTITEIKKARKICAGCPVARTCLTTSLENKDEYGVFAGSSSTDRNKMLKRIASGHTTIEEEVTNFMTWLREVVDV